MANAWIVKPLPVAAVTANTTGIGAPAFAVNDYAGMVWDSATGYDATITFDLGADVLFDTIMAFGIEGAVGGLVQIGIATTAQGLAYSGANTSSGVGAGNFWATTQSIAAGAVTPSSGRTVMIWGSSGTDMPPASARYVRLFFFGIGASDSIKIARVVIGKRIQLERNFSFGAALGVRDLGLLDFSARGVLLRRRAKKLRTIGLTFSSIRKAEVEAITQPLLEQIGNTDMIALLTDPAPDAQRQNRAYYGALVGDLSQVWRNAAAFEAKINLVSIF